MFFSQRELDVDSGQKGKDVRLQHCDENFKKRKDEAKREGANTEQREPAARREQEELGRREEQYEQKVADDHVHEQSQGQRDRANDKGRDELNRRHNDVHRPGHARREERVLKELCRALLDARVNEGHIRHHREHQGKADDAGNRNVRTRNDARDVECQDEEEDRRKDRQESLAVYLAEQVFSNAGAHEVHGHFDEGLESTGHNLHVSGASPEQDEQHEQHDHANDHDAVHLEGSALEQHRGREEIFDGRAMKPFARTLSSRQQTRGHEVQSVSEQRRSPDLVTSQQPVTSNDGRAHLREPLRGEKPPGARRYPSNNLAAKSNRMLSAHLTRKACVIE